jgi:hypothetical protein
VNRERGGGASPGLYSTIDGLGNMKAADGDPYYTDYSSKDGKVIRSECEERSNGFMM